MENYEISISDVVKIKLNQLHDLFINAFDKSYSKCLIQNKYGVPLYIFFSKIGPEVQAAFRRVHFVTK